MSAPATDKPEGRSDAVVEQAHAQIKAFQERAESARADFARRRDPNPS